jgi:hypothetical protein
VNRVTSIVEFCKQKIANEKAYKGKHFTALLSLVGSASKPHPTRLGQFSEKVSANNRGETAFQRALYKANKAVLCMGNSEEEITWIGMELPIVFSGRSRRPCIDLIGRCKQFGFFLCELKYATHDTYGAGNLPDFAILQAVLYYEIVERDHHRLDSRKVYRNSDRFNWKDVPQSKALMVLGNQNVWDKARKKDNPKRIAALITDIRELLGITVLLCFLPDYPFVGANKTDRRYEPEFVLPVGLKFPQLKMVDFIT